MEINPENERFLDRGLLIYEFSDEFLVICPKCKGMAKVVPFSITSEKTNSKLFTPRRLVCLNCVFRDYWQGNQIAAGGKVDWYFRLPLCY